MESKIDWEERWGKKLDAMNRRPYLWILECKDADLFWPLALPTWILASLH